MDCLKQEDTNTPPGTFPLFRRPPSPSFLRLLWLFWGLFLVRGFLPGETPSVAVAGTTAVAGKAAAETVATGTAAAGGRLLGPEEALKTLGQGGPELRWDPLRRSGVLSAGEHRASFLTGEPGERGMVLYDGQEILTLPQPYLEEGELRFPEGFILQLRSRFLRSFEEDQSRFRIAAIIVDPGHGGKDTGAVGNFVIAGKPFKSVEKDITLRTAKLLHARLSAAFPGKRILLTREGDTYPTLENRVALANSVHLKDNEAIIFISIHANASFNKQARGYEVWYLSPEFRRNVIDPSRYSGSKEVISILNGMMEEEFTTESVMMAQSIITRLAEAAGGSMPSRGIKAEEWFVVRNSRMPAVLVELGFVTNETDALLMNDETYLKNLSEALYKGINDFITLFERTGGFTVIP